MEEREVNQQIAEQICRTGSWNGREFHLREAVALQGCTESMRIDGLSYLCDDGIVRPVIR
jgi:hypothetical protein